MKLLLVRHGRMAGDPFCEPPSPVAGCLNPDGVAQATALGRALASTPVDAAFASPYGRAVETAERALAGRGLEVVRVPGLQEWTPSPGFRDATPTEASAMAARDADRFAEETWKTELGEGTFDVYARVVPALIGALASVGWHPRNGGWVPDPGSEKKTVAVFAHGGSLNAMLSFLLGVRPFPVGCFSFGYCGVATVAFSPRRGVWHPALELSAPVAPPVFEAGVSLGSNLGDRAGNLRRAVGLLAATPGVRLLGRSAIYETEPVDVPPEFAENGYLNACAVFEVSIPLADWSARCHAVEDELGRVRTGFHHPRTIDVDLLYFGDAVRDEPGLRLPHPQISSRRFVCEPLAELRPALRLPGLPGTVAELLAALPSSPSVRPSAERWD